MANERKGSKDSSAWSTWLRGVLNELLSPHFIIAILVLGTWAITIQRPIGSINSVAERLGTLTDPTQIAAARDALTALTTTAAAISALFTGVLGVVIGHYFGQRSGAASARADRLEGRQVANEAYQAVGRARKLLSDARNPREESPNINK